MNFNNPFYPNMGFDPMDRIRPQRTEVVILNGKGGVDALRMAENSSILAMDSTAPLVWLIKTDGAGYKTATAYQITPYTPPEPPDINALMERLNRLEGLIDGKESNAGSAKSRKGGASAAVTSE